MTRLACLVRFLARIRTAAGGVFLLPTVPGVWGVSSIGGLLCALGWLGSPGWGEARAQALAVTPLATQAAPAQMPLLNPPRPPIKPNLMITLDDSGSMGSVYLPENKIIIDGWEITSPANANSIRFEPADIIPGNVLGGNGTFTADPQSKDWEQRAMRSPDTNPVYYNPQVRYRPWLKPDGSRYPPAKIAAAVLDLSYGDAQTITVPSDPAPTPPQNPSGTTAPPPTVSYANVVDLSKTIDAKTATWCAMDQGAATVICRNESRAYAPGLYYRLLRAPGGAKFMDPQVAGNYEAFDANAAEGLPRGPGRSDCAAAQCTQAEEQQNFANWFVYYRSRLNLAKAVLGETLGRLKNQVRLGYGRLYQPARSLDGVGNFSTIVSGVRDFDVARKKEFLDWVYGLRYAGATPLGRAMQDVGTYYEVSDSRGPWGATPGTASDEPQASCRAAYHLLITDGSWTPNSAVQVGNVDGKDGPEIKLANGKVWKYSAQAPYKDNNLNFLGDVAMHFWNRDLRPDLSNHVPVRPGNEASWQSMSNFIVGLGVKGKLDPSKDLPALARGDKTWSMDKIDDLWHAALNSRGAYFDASNPQALLDSMRQILSSVAAVDRNQAGVVVTSREQVTGNRKYLATYRAGDWSGDLRAYALDAPGGLVWSGEQRLPPWQSRRIFIRDEDQPTPQAVPFEWGSLSQPLQTALGTGADTALVHYLRGDRSREGEEGWRARSGLLGDFIHSTPVVASASAEADLSKLPGIGASYDAYVKEIKGKRDRVIYVGGNGGMLHVFRDTAGADGTPAGREIYAYIPRAVAEQLALLKDVDYAGDRHRFFVDGPLQESDVHVPPPGGGDAAWRSYLFGSTGAGPAAVFALDVTDPATLGAASARWEIRAATEPRLGHVLTPVVTGRLPNGKWVALFGNGYGSAGQKSHLFVVEVASGTVQTVALPDDGATAFGLGGVALRKDDKGQIVGVYAGDQSGRLWRLDYSATASGHFTVALGGKPLFQALTGQPIVQAPLIQAKGSRTFVVVGTGQLITDADVKDTTVQAVYVVEDRSAETLPHPLAPGHLAEWTLAAVLPASPGDKTLFSLTPKSGEPQANVRGWRIDLTGVGVPAGLRVLQPLQALQDQFLVGAEAPPAAQVETKGDPCSDAVEGQGVNLLLSISASPVPKTPVLDTNSDGVVDSRDTAGVVGYGVAADGADAIAVPGQAGAAPAPAGGASGAAPAVSAASGLCANTVNLIGTGGATVACLVRAGLGILRDRVWRRILQPPF